MIKKIYLLSLLKDLVVHPYETLRTSLPQPIKTDWDKYNEMVAKDLKHLFTVTIYPMDYVKATYHSIYARLHRRSKGHHTVYELHEKAIEITERKLHSDTVNAR